MEQHNLFTYAGFPHTVYWQFFAIAIILVSEVARP